MFDKWLENYRLESLIQVWNSFGKIFNWFSLMILWKKKYVVDKNWHWNRQFSSTLKRNNAQLQDDILLSICSGKKGKSWTTDEERKILNKNIVIRVVKNRKTEQIYFLKATKKRNHLKNVEKILWTLFYIGICKDTWYPFNEIPSRLEILKKKRIINNSQAGPLRKFFLCVTSFIPWCKILNNIN